VQSSSEIITANKPTLSFLQAGCPSTDLLSAHSKLTWVLSTLSLTTEGSWLPWGVAKPLVIPLMTTPQLLAGLDN